VARDADAEAVINHLPRAEVDAGLINTLDGNNVTQKEHGLVIEVHDHAGLLQWFVRGLISTISPGERSLAGQRDPLRLVRSRVTYHDKWQCQCCALDDVPHRSVGVAVYQINVKAKVPAAVTAK